MIAEAAAASTSPLRRGFVMASVMISTMIFIMNATNVIVALPHMQGTFSATQDQIAWVLTSFIVAVTLATALTGRLSARFGRKRLYLLSIAGFTVSSFLCGTATTLEAEVLFRVLQGATGAPIVPLSQAIVLDSYPRERHAAALSFWGIGVTVGPVFGPILGGWVTEEFSWPWVFYFNIPFGLLVIVGTVLAVPRSPRGQDRSFDWSGFLALAIALTAVQLMLNRGQREDWFDSLEIILESAVAILCLYLFVIHSLTTRSPFIERSLFRDRNIVLGYLVLFCWALVLHSPLVLLSLRLQNLGHYPVLETGMLLAVRGVGGVLAMIVIVRIIGMVNAKHLTAIGLLCVAAAGWVMSGWSLDMSDWEVIYASFVLGFGIAFAWVPLTTMTFSTIDESHRTEGVVFYHLLLNMGSGVGITIAIIVFSLSIQVNHETLAAYITPYNELFRYQGLPESWQLAEPGALSALEAEVMRQSMSIAFNNCFRLVMLTALAITPLVYLFTSPRAEMRD